MITKEELEAKIERIPFAGCWIWLGSCGGHGYGDVRRGGRNHTVHRIAHTLYKGEIPPGMHVLHSCDVRSCANPDHLFLGSNLDNIRDRMAKGRSKGGRGRVPGVKYKRRNPNAYDCRRKCTPEQRSQIRAEYAAGGVTLDQLAQRYGVDRRAIWGYIHVKMVVGADA